jgi:hypothetical protein
MTRNPTSPTDLNPAAQPAFPGWDTTALSAFRRANEVYSAACFDAQREITEFVNSRLSAAAGANHELSACKTWSDALKVHQDWWTSAVQDYANGTARLIDIGAQLLSQEASLRTQPNRGDTQARVAP